MQSTKYKGVRTKRRSGRLFWTHDGTHGFPYTDEGERQAALAYDLKLIAVGKQPVNVLKKK